MIFALQFTLQFNIVIPFIMLQSLYLLKWKENILVLTLVRFYIRQKWILFQFKKFIITTVSSLNCLLLTDYVSVTSKTFKFNSMMWEPVHLEYDLKVVNGLIYKSLFKKLSSFPKFGCKKICISFCQQKTRIRRIQEYEKSVQQNLLILPILHNIFTLTNVFIQNNCSIGETPQTETWNNS